MTVDPDIEGYWEAESTFPNLSEPTREFMMIDGLGRILHEVVVQDDPIKRMPMLLWARLNPESPNSYTVCATPGTSKTWQVEMNVEDFRLRIRREADMEFRFDRADESQLPGRFVEFLERCIRKISKMETEAAQAEQVAVPGL